MQQHALLIGNSDGIGLATTKRLLEKGWHITSISRKGAPIQNSLLEHHVIDVCDEKYFLQMSELAKNTPFDLCIYFVGIGELLDFSNMNQESRIVDVNLMGMIKTVSAVIPQMVQRGAGHFIGLSSLADELISAEAPSYNASKAGFSNYLGGLALALKSKGVFVTNVRFGFVDTKMAKGNFKPFMMSAAQAAEHLEKCIIKKPISYTAPLQTILLVKLQKLMMKLHG